MAKEDEIVVYPDPRLPDAEQRRIMEENERAKMEHSRRREEERIQAGTLFDKLIGGIDAVKKLFSAHKKQVQQTKPEKTR